MDVENLKKGKSTVEKCLHELFQKGDLNPSETKAALDGMRLRDLLCAEIENCEMEKEYSEHGYSGYRAVPRHYEMTAYAPRRDAGGRYSGDPAYGIQGWYESRPMGGYYDNMDSYSRGYYDGRADIYGMHNGGYSRHSIGDRAVETLEQLMDSAKSEYEREELHKFIRMIRQAAD